MCLNEKARRIWGATEAKSIGRGGMTIVHEAIRLDYKTLQRGRREIDNPKILKNERIRKKGGGRTPLHKKEKKLLKRILNPLFACFSQKIASFFLFRA